MHAESTRPQKSSAAGPRRRRPDGPSRPGRSRPIRLVVIAAVIVVVLVWFRGRLGLVMLHDWAQRANAGLVVSALLLLPLVGFPVSVMHALTGARFGLEHGMELVGASIAVQLLASYGVVHAAPRFFARRFAWLRERLPPATHRPLTLFTMFLPGAPFFAQNYVLVLAGVPFRIFFFYCLPIHFGRSLIGVIFGEWSGHLTPARLAVLGGYALVVMLVCALSFRRLRARWHSRPPAEGDPMPPG
ncbi:MAG TPA: hypothetical protein VL200_06520 [Lacunisphaera sp.]|jgi:uncharacterized membrane protein YdjX (TVP38/TMEM64 family)|nr:hypothetical protein [Lacunisphaera sp.]